MAATGQKRERSLFGTVAFTLEEQQRTDAYLRQKLNQDNLSRRPGPGGRRLTYLESCKAIEIANDAFGFNGWSCRIVDCNLEYKDKSPDGRWSVGYSSVVRIELKDGSSHEDAGFGQSDGLKDLGQALDISRKASISDARKRALRLFGEYLGNSCYDKEHIKDVAANRAFNVPLQSPTSIKLEQVHALNQTVPTANQTVSTALISAIVPASHSEAQKNQTVTALQPQMRTKNDVIYPPCGPPGGRSNQGQKCAPNHAPPPHGGILSKKVPQANDYPAQKPPIHDGEHIIMASSHKKPPNATPPPEFQAQAVQQSNVNHHHPHQSGSISSIHALKPVVVKQELPPASMMSRPMRMMITPHNNLTMENRDEGGGRLQPSPSFASSSMNINMAQIGPAIHAHHNHDNSTGTGTSSSSCSLNQAQTRSSMSNNRPIADDYPPIIQDDLVNNSFDLDGLRSSQFEFVASPCRKKAKQT